MRVPNQFPSLEGRTKIALVGEAPASREVHEGRPFVGPAGKELDTWLSGIIVRNQCYVGNLCQVRAPADKLENMFLDSKCTTPNDTLAYWIQVLKEDLQSLRPDMVIALGRHATRVLTGKDGSMNWWGSVLPCTLVPGLRVMPLPHPSYVIRGKFELRQIVRHWLRRAKRYADNPSLAPPDRTYLTDPSLEEVLYHLERLMSAPVLASDIEVKTRASFQREGPRGLVYQAPVITCLSFSDSPDWAMCIPFFREGHPRWEISREMEIWRRISQLYAQKGPIKLFFNLMFDFLCLSAYGIYIAPPYRDAMVAHNRAFLDLTKNKLKPLKLNRLAFCVAFYTEETFYKDDHKQENLLDGWAGPDQLFWLYNCKDSIVLHEVMEGAKQRLEVLGNYELFLRDMEVFEPLAYMGLIGVRRDQPKLERLKVEVDRKIQSLQAELDEMVGHPLNTKSSDQMRKFLYGELGLPVQYHKDTGRPTTDESAIARLYNKTKLPVLWKVKELNRFRTFQQNYLSGSVSPDGRTRTVYNQAKTSTARVSSSTPFIGSGSNLQVVPAYEKAGEEDYNRVIKAFKSTFIPDPGKLMWRRDYEQAEARVVAYLTQDLQAIRDFEEGVDVHLRNLEVLWDTPYEVILQKYQEGDPVWKMRRKIGKQVKHAANYGMGPRELQTQLAKAGLEVPLAECTRMLKACTTTALQCWHAEVEDTIRRTRVLENCFGRKRYFFGPITPEVLREAIAFVPQSTVADMLNFALVAIYRELEGRLAGTDLLLQLHDAVVGQSPEEVAHEHAKLVGELMTIPLKVKGRTMVIPSSLEIGPSWGELTKWPGG